MKVIPFSLTFTLGHFSRPPAGMSTSNVRSTDQDKTTVALEPVVIFIANRIKSYMQKGNHIGKLSYKLNSSIYTSPASAIVEETVGACHNTRLVESQARASDI